MSDVAVNEIGFALVILGFILAFVAMILLAIRPRSNGGKTHGGGVLFIGPIPIIFGTDRETTKIMMILAIILIVVILVFMIVPSLLMR